MKALARRLGALGVACLGLLVVHALVVNVLVLRSLGVPIRPAFGLGSVPAFLRALGLGVLGAAALRAALLLASRRRGRSLLYLRLLLLRPRSLAGLLAAGATFALTSYGYVWLKVFVPVLNETLVDQQLYALDNWLHLGVNPNRFLLALVEPFPAVLWLLDLEYAWFAPSLLAGIAWFVATPSSVERRRFATGFAAVWMAGAWLYLAVPSLGPCYAMASDYAAVRPHLYHAVATQETLIRHYGGMRSIRRATETRPIYPVLGVAAFPSLHVGAHAFLALWARRRHRPLSVLFTVVTAATFVGSLVTGWHYAVDGYAGLLLAWGGARLSGPPRGLG